MLATTIVAVVALGAVTETRKKTFHRVLARAADALVFVLFRLNDTTRAAQNGWPGRTPAVIHLLEGHDCLLAAR